MGDRKRECENSGIVSEEIRSSIKVIPDEAMILRAKKAEEARRAQKQARVCEEEGRAGQVRVCEADF